jgi:arylsulfatase A-like enzyme
LSKRILILLLCCIAVSCKKPEQPQQTQIKRILLITIDTLRADALSVYGNKTKTPFFDELARRSIVYENAFTCVPITLPAHTSLLTGLYPPSHGVRNNGTFRAPAELDLLSEYAKQNGFSTAAVIGGFPLSAQFCLNQGFDLYDDHFPKRESAPGLYLYAEKDAEQVRKSAEDWLSKHSSDPFFLWLHFFDPHHPYRDHGLKDVANYEQEVLYVDRQLGLFFDFMKQKKLDEQLLTIVTSDHGEAFGEHGEISHSVFIYNTTLRIPLLLSVPGHSVGRENQLVRIIDVAPTIVGLLAWKTNSKMDGSTMLQHLRVPTELYAETLASALDFGWSPLFSIQNLNSKFILAPHSEFYELKQDPGETKNKITSINPDDYRKNIEEITRRTPVSKNTAHTPTTEERQKL